LVVLGDSLFGGAGDDFLIGSGAPELLHGEAAEGNYLDGDGQIESLVQ
jgi:hypothetical protein